MIDRPRSQEERLAEEKEQALQVDVEFLVREFGEKGLTPDAAKQWLTDIESPLKNWVDITNTVPAGYGSDEELKQAREQHLDAVTSALHTLLSTQPDLPPELIRPLTSRSISKALRTGEMKSRVPQHNIHERIYKQQGPLIDAALRFYYDQARGSER